MALHQLLSPRIAISGSAWDRAERLETELQEARSILHRLLQAEDRPGLVHPVIDDARHWLARTNRG
jgi:hypothetical protein